MVWDDGAEEVLYLQRYGNGREEVNRYSIEPDNTCPNRKGPWRFALFAVLVGLGLTWAVAKVVGW